jgi:carboxyl-terminal processing protease
MKLNRILLSTLFVGLMVWVLFACASAGTQPTTLPLKATATPTGDIRPSSSDNSPATLETRLTANERAAIFEAVWQTVNDKYFDPTFGGVDWQAIGDEYRQELAAVDNDYAFWFEVLNPMLFELGVSHIAALPAELTNELEHMTFATGSLGVDVRLLVDELVITRIIAGSPADKAGLRPGFVIDSVDGRTVEDIAAEGLQTPPYNERHQQGKLAGDMRAMMFGETGQQVVIEYLDANDQPGQAVLQFAPRSSAVCGQIDPAMPPACAEVEFRRLADGIGYLRFSGFLEPALDSVLAAIDELHDAPAMIIDLRGNPGGTFPVRKAIASKLVGKPKPFIRYQLRTGLEETYLDPVPDVYAGEVVILVDELSESSSEEFTGSLQSLGRATIVGSQTPGSCLVMNTELLPNDALLVYPYGQSQTPDGRILEGNGVIPDIEVFLDRQQLLQGMDAQLRAAIDYLLETEK